MSDHLLEAVNYSYYADKLSENTFNDLMELDPTKDLKYGRWIVQAYLNEFGTIEKAQFEIGELQDRKNAIGVEMRQAIAVSDTLNAQRLRTEYQEVAFKIQELIYFLHLSLQTLLE